MKLETRMAKILSEKYDVPSYFVEQIIAGDGGNDGSFYQTLSITSRYGARKITPDALFSYHFEIEFSDCDFENDNFEVKCVNISIYKNDSKDDDGEFDGDYEFEKELKVSLKEAYDFVLESELKLEF